MKSRIATLGIAVGLATGAFAADKPSFKNLDANNDGKLTIAEAGADTRISRDFKRADRNNDHRLDRKEFEAALRMRNEPVTIGQDEKTKARSDGEKHRR